jgi:hypothetical protein
VQVADEMNHEFEGLCLSVFARVRVFQDGEELFRLGDYAITIRALAGQVDLGIRQGDVDVMPRSSLTVIALVLVGPACHGINCAAIQEITRLGQRSGRHILLGNQPNDFMAFPAPRKAGRRRQDEGK